MGNLSSQDTEESLLRLSERSVRNCSEVFLKTTVPHRIASRIISPGWSDDYSDPNNAATEQMYVKVNSSNKVIYGGDLTQTDWQEFSVDLASLGIDLSNVSSLTIGFERIGATGGSGMVFIDDILLYSHL